MFFKEKDVSKRFRPSLDPSAESAAECFTTCPPSNCDSLCFSRHRVWVGTTLQALVYDILPSKHWFTTSFLHPAVFSYAIGSRKLSANEQFFVAAQTVVSLLPTSQIISDVRFIMTMLLTPAQIKPGVDASHVLRACLGARLLPQSYQHPNLSEGADRAGRELRGDKECPFSGVNKSGRAWRKVPESDARL